jgi:porin
MKGLGLGTVAGALALGVAQGAEELDAMGGRLPVESRDSLRETGLEREHLTGDWGGWRTNLTDRGVHFQFGYIGEGFGNVTGGRRRGVAFEGLGEMAVEVDLERLANWGGARFRASSLWLHGRGPAGKLVGDALGSSNIEAHDSVRLYELWLEQNFLEGAFSVRVGSMLADEEFAGTDFGGLLLNSAFGWPAFISGNVINTGPAFYVAALGARLRYAPSDRWYVQTALLDGDSFDSASGNPRRNASGVRWRLDSDQGALSMSELGFNWNSDEQSAGLPGTVKLGAWFHTADFSDNARSQRTHEFNYGGYIAAQQLLCREDGDAEQGLGVFLRLGASPEDRSAFGFVLDAGLHYTGLLPGRDEDRCALGFVHADFSDTRAGYRLFRDYEQVVEFTYEFVVKPWWTIQPDFQWINNPAGDSGPSDAFLIGLRSAITF